jgi:galactose mutarotase-like enzyme
MGIMEIENDYLRVAVAESYGARVVGLFDKTSGREWMTMGGQSPNTGEGAVYAGEEAVAWDECFPTVGAWDAGATPWRRRLRDHGDLWGRPWTVEEASSDGMTLSLSDRDFQFVRRLSLADRSLIADYAVTNRSGESLPYLWALHALLAVKEGDRIELPGAKTVQCSFMALGGERLPHAEVSWDGDNEGLPFRLSEVQPETANFAGKFLVGDMPGGRVRIGQAGERLEYSWDSSICDLGVWITYGAWPSPGLGAHYEVALEPQSASANDVGQAMEAGARPLAPGEERRWQVRLTVSG